MSQENVEIVRQSLEAYTRGEVEEMLSYIDPEGELHSAIIGGAEAKVFRDMTDFSGGLPKSPSRHGEASSVRSSRRRKTPLSSAPAPRVVRSESGGIGPRNSVLVWGDHHPNHRDTHRCARQPADYGQGRNAEDDSRDQDQACDAATKHPPTMMREMLLDCCHCALLS